MSSLFALIKVELLGMLSSFSSKKIRDPKKKSVPALIIGAILLLLFAFMSAAYTWVFAFTFKEAHASLKGIVVLFGAFTSMAIMSTTMHQARGIYISEDYDLLITLPLKKSYIIISKLISLFAFELLFSMALLIPSGIVLAIMSHKVIFFLVDLSLVIFVPILPLAVASIVSLLLTMATAKFRYANIVMMLLYLPFLVGLMVVGVVMRNMSANDFSTMANIMKWINPTLAILDLALRDKSFLFAGLFYGVNTLILVAIIALLSTLYTKLHELVTSIKVSKTYVRKDLKIQNEFGMLLRLELKRLINSKMYFLNSVLGAIGSIAIIVVTLISMNLIKADEAAAPYVDELMLPIAISVLLFMFAIANPSEAAISMEGKSFWLSKTLPINTKKYMHAKIFLTYVIFIPCSLIASTVTVIFAHNDIFGCIMAYVLPIAMIIFDGIFALFLNASFPKFKWKSETEVVKNSLPVALNMLIVGGINFFLAGAMIGFAFLFSWIGYIFVLIVLVILTVIFYIILRKTFEKKINQAEDL